MKYKVMYTAEDFDFFQVDKPDKSDILNVQEKKPCEITVLFSHGFLENVS